MMDKHSSTKPYRIIIADDDFEDFRLMKDIFENVHPGIHLSHVEDGQYLMDILKAQSKNNKFGELPHLIILDLNMPRKNGLEVVKEIKDNSLLRKIPIIIFTTSKTQKDIEQSYELGASCYVTKPKTVEAWKKAITSLCHFWIENVTVAITL